MAQDKSTPRHSGHSSERRFEKLSTLMGDRYVSVRRVFCSTPGCGQQGEILDQTSSGLPSFEVARRLTKKGWEVGHNERHDFCPACVEKARIERRQRRFKPIVVSSSTEPKGEPAMPTADTMLPEVPRDMSRSDRRIIFAKLEETYLDEERGYQTPWTDAAVARDLGSHIPIGWVAAVREENFGPAKDNAEIRDMLVRVEQAAREAKAVLDEAKAIRKDIAGAVETTNAIMKRATEIGKTLDGLLAIAERIERSMS